MVRGAELGARDVAPVVAALLEERDILRGEGGPPPADFALRVDAVRARGGRSAPAGCRVDAGAVRRVQESGVQVAQHPAGHRAGPRRQRPATRRASGCCSPSPTPTALRNAGRASARAT